MVQWSTTGRSSKDSLLSLPDEEYLGPFGFGTFLFVVPVETGVGAPGVHSLVWRRDSVSVH